MSAAREEILARVRAAKGAAAQGTAAGAPPIPREYRAKDERPPGQLVTLFCERVDDYKAQVERVTAEQLPAAICAAASRHGAKRLAIPPALPEDWRAPGLEPVVDQALTPRELDQLDGVITGCTVAIAETGTIALSGAPHEGRRLLTLVPDLHICIVNQSQIVGGVPEAITLLGEITRQDGRPVTLISGPSATSDIELQRVEGVHGPRKLVVLVVEENAGTD